MSETYRAMDAATAREQDLFEAALRVVTAAEREVFLDQSCADNPRLRARMKKLLAAHSDSDRFFSECITAVAPAVNGGAPSPELLKAETSPVAGQKLGTRIGHYQLLQSLGEGGCGEVYLAEQTEPVRRRVALKVIKLGMDTKSVIARFEAERQALALMDHPNIAKVLDAGTTETGRPFFVMELVQGLRITEYCDKNHLDVRQRLLLFVQICNAIQHAHQKGVVHRDIKPSNVLVTIHDDTPVPKVIDFGIAKFIEMKPAEKTFSTLQGQLIGTPAYMSPEQANMGGFDIDTRSDIYSLGVLLYELLTGRPPFDQKQLLNSGLETIRRTLMEKEPQRPSTMITTLPGDERLAIARNRRVDYRKLVSLVNGELDWIVMKALDKDRQRRYQTANGLAMDVKRYLANESVSACPPSRLYQFQKLVRRNKVTFTFGTLLVLALTIGFGASSWMYVCERDARHVADQLRAEAELGRAREASLRQEAESHEMLLHAAALLRSNRWEEADSLVATMPQCQMVEGATIFRRLGNWRASRQEWHAAAVDFEAVERANHADELDQASLDYLSETTVLVMAKDQAAYDKLRRESIRRFADTADPIVAERFLKDSLLTPATPEMLAPLKHQAEYLATFVNGVSRDYPSVTTWQYAALGLYYYRQGRYADGAASCNKCIECKDPDPISARITYANIILAMCEYRLGQTNEARMHFDAGNFNVEKVMRIGYPQGNSISGNWFDWVFAQILSNEASTFLKEDEEVL